MRCSVRQRCISYYSYIKPQPEHKDCCMKAVVYRTIPTSNHNKDIDLDAIIRLYIVLFLHQTTTITGTLIFEDGCISYYSYIKPQLTMYLLTEMESCISYYSYIKPQPMSAADRARYVVYRTIPTSNHNYIQAEEFRLRLYIVLFLHQTTTNTCVSCPSTSCISYYSYIKPQLIMLI